MSRVTVAAIIGLLWMNAAFGDEAPISGTVQSIDTAAKTLVIQTTSQGKTRQITIYLKPESRVVRFARAADPAKTGFVEQDIALGDLKPGWVVSVTAKHEGGREVAETVKVVFER
jgi:hypothetical protein